MRSAAGGGVNGRDRRRRSEVKLHISPSGTLLGGAVATSGYRAYRMQQEVTGVTPPASLSAHCGYHGNTRNTHARLVATDNPRPPLPPCVGVDNSLANDACSECWTGLTFEYDSSVEPRFRSRGLFQFIWFCRFISFCSYLFFH